MDNLNFPEMLLFKKSQNGKEKGKAFSIFQKNEIHSKHYSINLTELSRDSRNGTKRDSLDFYAIPAHPIRGVRNGNGI